MATKKTKAVGTAVLVELAITALKSPAVQNALKQAPSYLARYRSERKRRRDGTGDVAIGSGNAAARPPHLTDRFGQHRLEKRAADIRTLVDDLAFLPAGKRVDPATVQTVTDALDAIDFELRLASHQGFVDRKRHHRRISVQLDGLVNALAVPVASELP